MCFTKILSCSHISIKLSRNFATAIRDVAIKALELYTAVGFVPNLNGVTFSEKLFFTRKLNLVFFHINPEVLEKLFNLIYYVILTLTLIPQLSPNPNRKPHIKCTRMLCSFSLCKIIFPGEIA